MGSGASTPSNLSVDSLQQSIQSNFGVNATEAKQRTDSIYKSIVTTKISAGLVGSDFTTPIKEDNQENMNMDTLQNKKLEMGELSKKLCFKSKLLNTRNKKKTRKRKAKQILQVVIKVTLQGKPLGISQNTLPSTGSGSTSLAVMASRTDALEKWKKKRWQTKR